MGRPKITPAYVIDALGGSQQVARITRANIRAVYNWRNSKFPANTYVAIQTQLAKHKMRAPDRLWTMRGLPGDKRRKRNGK